jgi:hypothetical protein
LGDCDSPRLETDPDYLTQLAAVSHRGLLPSPSFAFDDVRTSPEEPVNSASPELSLWFQRSRINQPDPAFPRSPGIIHKRYNLNLTINRCDSLRLETGLNYLTRLGAVSALLLAAKFLIRVWHLRKVVCRLFRIWMSEISNHHDHQEPFKATNRFALGLNYSQKVTSCPGKQAASASKFDHCTSDPNTAPIPERTPVISWRIVALAPAGIQP